MRTHSVDEAIERYVRERMIRGGKEAGERFLSYAHMRYQGSELAEFLEKTTGLVRYYIEFFRVMINPLKGPDLAFFATAITMAVFGVLMMFEPEERNVGIFILSGALVHGCSIIRHIIRKWCDLSVLIAIYREILTLVESEMTTGSAPAE